MHPSIAHEDRELPVELSDLRAQLNQATTPVSLSPQSHSKATDKTIETINTFESLLGHSSSWRPTSLERPYTSWTGAVQRYRLVKDLRAGSMCVVTSEGKSGGDGVRRGSTDISEQALTLGIWLIEKSDSHAASERFNEALFYASEVSRFFPQYAIGYMRLAQLLCVTRGQHLTGGSAVPSRSSNGKTKQTNEGLTISPLMSDVAALLSCAVGLEPTNSHVAGCADLLLSLLCGMPTSADVWDPTLYPRSLGDAVCLAFLAAPDADVQARRLVDGAASATTKGMSGGGATGTEEEIAV